MLKYILKFAVSSEVWSEPTRCVVFAEGTWDTIYIYKYLNTYCTKIITLFPIVQYIQYTHFFNFAIDTSRQPFEDLYRRINMLSPLSIVLYSKVYLSQIVEAVFWKYRGKNWRTLLTTLYVSEYSNQVTQGIRAGTWDTINTLKFRAAAADDGATIRCVAEHRALKHNTMERRIELTVYCTWSQSYTNLLVFVVFIRNLSSYDIFSPQTRPGLRWCPAPGTAWWARASWCRSAARSGGATPPPSWPGTGTTSSCSSPARGQLGSI